MYKAAIMSTLVDLVDEVDLESKLYSTCTGGIRERIKNVLKLWEMKN